MSMPRCLLATTCLAAVLVTTIAVPVAAARTKLTIVNGLPGKRVDVCINGREVTSGLRYGGAIFRTTRTAKATVKFYKRDPRRCRGKLLAKRTRGFDDATWVITRRSPLKVVVFDNAFLAQPVFPDGNWWSHRHAADVGPADFLWDLDEPTPGPIGFVSLGFVKGDETRLGLGGAQDWVQTVYVRQNGKDVVRPFSRWVGHERRSEWILVGTRKKNAKLVFIDRRATTEP